MVWNMGTRSVGVWNMGMRQVMYPGIGIWVVRSSEVGTIHELEVFLDSDGGASQDGVEVECVADILQHRRFHTVFNVHI